MKLKLPEVALVRFRADLPEWMGAGLFIEIDGRPAGRVNQEFMAAQEAVGLAHRVREAKLATITDPGDVISETATAAKAFSAEWLGLIYDHCIVAWRTNLVDAGTGKKLTCDRETFLELADVKIGEIAKAFRDFQTAIDDAGKAVTADTEATIKN